MRKARPARFWQRLRLRIRQALGQSKFLCDDCKWDWPSACHRRERPNATECPDYTPKGR